MSQKKQKDFSSLNVFTAEVAEKSYMAGMPVNHPIRKS